MTKLDPSSHHLRQRAHQGDLGALTQLLASIICTDPTQIRVERHHQTLQVDLQTLGQGSPENHGLVIYGAVYTLGLEGVTQLRVVAEHSPNNHRPWQQHFALGSAAASAPLSLPAVPTPDNAPEEISRWSYGGNPLLATVYLPQTGSALGAESNQPALPPETFWPERLAVRLKGTRGVGLALFLTFSFLLGAGMAQWRLGQPHGEPDAPLQASPVRAAPAAPSPQRTTVEPEAAADAGPAAIATASNSHAQGAAAPEPAPTVTIKAVGDMIMGTNYPRTRMPEDWQYFFDGIKFHLKEADLVFGNFESTLTEVPNSAKNTSRPMTFAFRSPPWYASVLRAAGFDVLSVANNHSMDFFGQGFDDTIANIESEGMIAVGRKGDIQYAEVNGVKVAFIGFSYLSVHNSVHDLEAAGALVQEAEQNADVVVISVHAGKEGTDAVFSRNQEEFFYSENRGNLVHFSRTVVDYGADLVLGHGPHVPRAIELYNNRLIAYSLGNFLGYRTLSTQGPLGLSMILQVELAEDGQFLKGRIIPAALDPNGVPYLDNHFGSVILVRNATRRDFPDTPLVIDDLGYIVRRE